MTTIRMFKFFSHMLIFFVGLLSSQALSSNKFTDFVTDMSNEAEQKGVSLEVEKGKIEEREKEKRKRRERKRWKRKRENGTK